MVFKNGVTLWLLHSLYKSGVMSLIQIFSSLDETLKRGPFSIWHKLLSGTWSTKSAKSLERIYSRRSHTCPTSNRTTVSHYMRKAARLICAMLRHGSWSVTQLKIYFLFFKALAWCPWRSSILATGGGSSDGHIRVWHIHTGEKKNEVDTKSQVTKHIIYEPPRGKTNNVVSEQVRHKPACTVTEAG